MKSNRPEQTMKIGFESFFKAINAFRQAKIYYQERNDINKADKENVINMGNAIDYMSKAYDEISAIWENDL